MPIPEKYMLEKGFENKKKEYEVFIKKLQEKEGKNIIVINSLPELEKHMEEFIFFRTESSWTMRGAFYGMQEYRKKLEYKADDLNRYREYMFSVFTGDLKAKAVLLWENSSYEDVVRNIPNDPYYIYMGEDNPNRQKLTVDKGEKSKACNTLQMSSAGTAGIIGHSYIHSIVKGSGTGRIILLTDFRGKYLISFLSELYEEIYVVNIREDKQFLADLNDLTEKEGFDQILWAQNASEIGDKSYMSAISPLLDGRKRGES